ncbi:glycosyltransferase [Salegentibacter sp. Hel_I_6]|uniref:glycosyltransferase n=1 Tax=Salegentibacter sp. Hel_I_6 TaxID=1250278 RepID=UPI00069255DA|nr:glycosyltransferase [Salegentibacter sp. Hel_I_6]
MDFSTFKNNFEKRKVEEVTNQCSASSLLSVCVQTYNQAEYIEKCLDNILNQKTNFEFEILLGEDFSTDGTREICLKYARLFPDKIRLFLHHRENNISIASKPTGIFNSVYNLFSSNGQFIAYCDGDDMWTDKYKLQKQVDYLFANPDTSLTYHKVNLIDENDVPILKNEEISLSERDFSALELQRAYIQPPISTWCFRNLIQDIPVEFTKIFNGDNFWISLLGNYGKGKFLKEIEPSLYRIHSRAMWSSIERSIQLKSKFNTYILLSKYYKASSRLELSNYFKDRANAYAKMVFSNYIKAGRFIALFKFLRFYLKMISF